MKIDFLHNDLLRLKSVILTMRWPFEGSQILKGMLFLFVACPAFLVADHAYTIIFVHIGSRLPSHLSIAMSQAYLFNPEANIVLIASNEALEGFSQPFAMTCLSCEDLPLTEEHAAFLIKNKLDGYARYTSERFFYLHDYMQAYDAHNVFHIENDVLLYVDLGELLPVFQKHYPGIAATFESDVKCIPGFLFIANNGVMKALVQCFMRKITRALWDMTVLAEFRRENKINIDTLPVIMPSYILEHTPPALGQRLLKEQLWFCNYIDEFVSIFDAAAIGIYFDGLQTVKGNYPPGYCISSIFNPSLLTYTWERDDQSRMVPYVLYGGKKYRINNLHIASKRLERFIFP